MKMYVLVILTTGPKTDATPDKRKTLFTGHMTNLKRLAAEGKLVVAGPFEDNADHLEGIFVFNVTKVADAQALLATGPAVSAGLLPFDAYEWYATAALQEVTALHNRTDKTSH